MKKVSKIKRIICKLLSVKFLSFVLITAMLLPVITPFATVAYAASQAKRELACEDALYVRYGNPYQEQGYLVLDGRPGARRVALIKFDLSDYKYTYEAISEIKLRYNVSYYDVGSFSDSVYVDVLPQEAEIYYDERMDWAHAEEHGMVTYVAGATPESAISPLGPPGNNRSANISEQIKDNLRENPEDCNVVLRMDVSTICAVLSGKAGSTVLKPNLEIKFDGRFTTLENIVDSVKSTLPMAMDSKFTIPDSIGEADIYWTTEDSQWINEDGSLSSRPAFGEDDVNATIDVEVEYNGLTKKFEHEILVLSEGSYEAKTIEHQHHKIELEAQMTTPSEQTAQYCLEVENKLFYNAATYVLILPDGTQIPFVPTLTKEYTKIPLKDFSPEGAQEFTITTEEGKFNDGAFVSIVRAQDAHTKQLADIAETLIDDTEVLDDLNLVESVDDIEIQWSSSNESCISNDGVVTRPYSNEIIKTVDLSATLSKDGKSYVKTFCLKVPPRDGVPEYRPLTDPGHMSDERFFGLWDESLADPWKIKPVLQYARVPELSGVLEYVKDGDYESAKNELLTYYRTRDGIEYESNASANFSVMAEAGKDMLMGYLSINYATIDVDTNWDYYVAKLPSLKQSITLVDTDMDGSYAIMQSKENPQGNPPELEVVAGGNVYICPVIADTYISAGANHSQMYGKEGYMYAREAGDGGELPFGDNTARTYLRFNTSGIEGEVTSIKLRIYARAPQGKKTLQIIGYGGTPTDTDFSWDSVVPEYFNFKETGYIWRERHYHETEHSVETEWIHYVARLYPIDQLLAMYKGTGDESYAYAALELVNSIYTQQPSGTYPRAMDANWRGPKLLATFFETLDSDLVTPELAVAQLKYMYEHMYKLRTEVIYNEFANSATAALLSFLGFCAYFPEMAENGWWEFGKDMAVSIIDGGDLLNADGSYIESCSNYIYSMLLEFIDLLSIIRKVESEDDPQLQRLLNQYDQFSKYYINMTMNYGKTPAWGDGNRQDTSGYQAAVFDNFRSNDFFRYIATKGQEGKEPDYTSYYYPDKGVIFMRSDWHTDGFSAMFNNDFGGGHCHRDDLALDVYAYGRPLLIDAGHNNYDTSSAMAGTEKLPTSHNTIQVDDLDQQFEYWDRTPQKISYTTNKLFDFVDAGNPLIYPGHSTNRKILFLHNSYWIVSDYITSPGGTHDYKVIWRPDAKSNFTVDAETKAMTTNYDEKANIKVVPADPETIEAITETEWMMAEDGGGGVTRQPYLTYVREDVEGAQTFDSVLYPYRLGEEADVSVERIEMENTPTSTATALKIHIGNNLGYYYATNEETPGTRSFDKYTSDGRLAYVEEGYGEVLKIAALFEGKSIKDGDKVLLETQEAMSDIGVQWNGATVELYTSEKIPQSGIKVYTDTEAAAVLVNGKSVDFEYSNNYIYINKEADEEDSGSNTGGTSGGNGTPDGNGGATNPIKGGGNSSGNKPSGSSTPGGIGGTVVPVVPVQPEMVFGDIENHWAKNEILNMYDKKIVNGVSSQVFAPDKEITRAEFIAILARAFGIDSSQAFRGTFNDVKEDEWFAGVVEAAAQIGVVNGYEDGSFRPNAVITRQEMSKMLIEFAEYGNVELSEENEYPEFFDESNISSWAKDYVKRVVQLGLMVGVQGDTFAPEQSATRAQATVVADRIYKLIKG